MTESHMHNVETFRAMYITCINFLELGSHACLYDQLAIIVVQSGPNVVPGNMGSLEGQGYL